MLIPCDAPKPSPKMMTVVLIGPSFGVMLLTVISRPEPPGPLLNDG